jgi:hypothetical protein
MLGQDIEIAPRFRPIRFLSNPHIQTILGFLWRGRRFRHPARAIKLQLSDGDGLIVHDSVPERWHPARPSALLIHGMGGNSNSGYVQRVGNRLYRRNVRVVRIDLRGTGAGFGIAEKFYHMGRSEDIRSALIAMNEWAPDSPLFVVGFSLGGNLALKCAGESAEQPIPMLARVAAIAPPIDVPRCSEMISQPRNRIYDRFFARKLISLARQRQEYYPEPPLPEFPRGTSIRQFDNLYTAPRCGFADADDYYRRSSALPLISKIAVPTLMVAARDDPFVAIAPFEELSVGPHIQVEIHDRGGHLGFLGPDGEGGFRWVERRLVDWLLESEYA